MNIIIFLYDSLIAPMLSSFGGDAPTPAFDFFANGGARFKKTAAHSLRSDVALGTILTGCYPHHNGIHKMILAEKQPQTGQGYMRDDIKNLVSTAQWNSYRVRLFNCAISSSSCIWYNRPVTPPHMDQLMHFINESGKGPFLLVDRFTRTAFPWRPDLPYDRLETEEEHRELALLALRSAKSRSLVIKRMQHAVMKEDARLMRIINLLHRHSLMEKTVVVIAGIPGDVNEQEMNALNNLAGNLDSNNKQNRPLFPTIIWHPKHVSPVAFDETVIRHIDIMPTLLSIAGLKQEQETDGLDLMPALRNKNLVPCETLTFYDDRIEHTGKESVASIALEPDSSPDREPEPDEQKTGLYKLMDSPPIMPKRNGALLNRYVITKKTLFFVALARGGTQFFTRFFQRDEFTNVLCKGHLWPRLNNVNVLYDSNQLSGEGVKEAICRFKPEIMDARQETLVSVSHDYWAIIEQLAEVFVNSKFVFISRDPRKFILSAASHPPEVQNINKSRASLPYLTYDTLPSAARRPAKNGFVGPASYWWNSYTKSYYDAVTKLGDRGLVVRFEDIFAPESGFPGMKTIADFVKELVVIPVNDGWLGPAFETKVNSFSYSFPQWKDWKEEDRNTLAESCGNTMALLGYDINKNP